MATIHHKHFSQIKQKHARFERQMGPAKQKPPRSDQRPVRGGLHSKVQEHLKKAGIGGKTNAKENPFDKFANARKKHEVINRRVKGEDRNVGRARSKVSEFEKLFVPILIPVLGNR